MKENKRSIKTVLQGGVFFLALLLLFSPQLVSAASISILNEGPILSDQELSFTTCLQEPSSIRHSLFCIETQETRSVPAEVFTPNCAVSSVDLSDFLCSTIEISAFYQEQGFSRKSTRTVLTQKALTNPSTIIQKQEWDGGFGTPSHTGYAIWILSRYSPDFDKEIDEALEWLKLQRRDLEKCFVAPNGQCSIYETARTLAFLHFAGFNLTNKVYQDGVVWLESQMNFIQDTPFEIELVPSRDGVCSVKFNDASLFSNDVVANEIITIPFTPVYEGLLNVSCKDMGEQVTIYDSLGRNIFHHTFTSNSDSYFDYTLQNPSSTDLRDVSLFRFPPPCFSAGKKWDYCHRETTLYALLIPELDEERRSLAGEWLEGQLRPGNVVGSFLSTAQSIADTAMFLFAFDPDNAQVLQWLIHRQNNDGSWGEGSIENRVKSTAYALLALREQSFPGKEFVISEGLSFLSREYPPNGWSDFELEAVSFLILRDVGDKRLRGIPNPVLLSSGAKSVHLHNPTTVDLTDISIRLTGNLASAVDISSPGTIAAHSSKDISISPKATRSGHYAGLAVFEYENTSLLSLPIIYTQDVIFDLTLSQNKVYFFSDIQHISFTANTNTDFTCTLSFADQSIMPPESFSVNSRGRVQVPIQITDTSSKSVSGLASCQTSSSQAKTSTYEFPFEFDLVYYDVAPFTVRPSSVSMRGQNNGTIRVTNNLEESIVVAFAFTTNPAYMTMSRSSIEIAPRETETVSIINFAIPLENLTTTETVFLEISSLGEVVVTEVSLLVRPLGEEGNTFLRLLIILFVFLGIGGASFYFLKNKSVKKDSPKKDVSFKKRFAEFKIELREHLPDSLKKYIPKSPEEIELEKKHKRELLQRSHLKDMVVVMKKMDKTNDEIKSKLLEEGLDVSEVESILSMVALEEKIDTSIKEEEETLQILKSIEENPAAKESLQQKGFTQESIKKALEELKSDVLKKEEELKKDMASAKDSSKETEDTKKGGKK